MNKANDMGIQALCADIEAWPDQLIVHEGYRETAQRCVAAVIPYLEALRVGEGYQAGAEIERDNVKLLCHKAMARLSQLVPDRLGPGAARQALLNLCEDDQPIRGLLAPERKALDATRTKLASHLRATRGQPRPSRGDRDCQLERAGEVFMTRYENAYRELARDEGPKPSDTAGDRPNDV